MTNGPRRVTGLQSWSALTATQRGTRGRALEALSRMRTDGLSLSAASRAAGTTPGTVRRYAGQALISDGHHARVTASDRLYRRMSILSSDGRVEVDVRSSAQASRVAAHYNAIDFYLRTGNAQPLKRFARISVGGRRLATDLEQVERWARAGELSIDDIYPAR
jgi:hypothetical protein